MKLQLLCMVGIIVLSIAAEKCRLLVGDKVASSRSRTERFTFLNCFDMSYGTIACVVKECVKLYFEYIRAVHVQKVRNDEGDAAATQAYRQAKHIMAPLLSSAWDLFETMYFGGALAEGLIRATGTFFGAYAGGFIGEVRLGWLGFLVGSHLGSWTGGRIGLMVYDVGYGVQYLLDLVQSESNPYMPMDSSL
ncbi:uncharacterized protein LOC132310076 [Cornus florida]|uniref:uncharacterized protein LOC132310076 n=1 Tax=Cornus florida TaxID=4283 RepID=UPI0028A21467|nr:uncharacterized protein LOC132310076 [Cornus florida]